MRIKLQSLLAALSLLVFLFPLPAALAHPEVKQPSGEFFPGEVVIGMKESVSAASLRLPAGVAIRRTSRALDALHVAVMRVPEGQEQEYARKLRCVAGVLFAEPNYIVRADFIQMTRSGRNSTVRP